MTKKRSPQKSGTDLLPLAAASAAVAGLYWYFSRTTSKGKPIMPGAIAGLTIEWKNVGPFSFQPEFRYDAKQDRPLTTWEKMTWPWAQPGYSSGGWTLAQNLGPGETQVMTLETQMHTDWGGHSISVRLRARIPDFAGEDTIWSQDKAYYIE